MNASRILINLLPLPRRNQLVKSQHHHHHSHHLVLMLTVPRDRPITLSFGMPSELVHCGHSHKVHRVVHPPLGCIMRIRTVLLEVHLLPFTWVIQAIKLVGPPPRLARLILPQSLHQKRPRQKMVRFYQMGMVPRTMAFKMCQSNGSIRKKKDTMNTIETNIQTPWTGYHRISYLVRGRRDNLSFACNSCYANSSLTSTNAKLRFFCSKLMKCSNIILLSRRPVTNKTIQFLLRGHHQLFQMAS